MKYQSVHWPFKGIGRGCAVMGHRVIDTLSKLTPKFGLILRFSRVGPRGRGREWATLGVHPLSWLLSNNRLEEVCGTLTKGTFSSLLLLSNQDKGCTPSVAHSLPLPLPPGFCSTCQVWYVLMGSKWGQNKLFWHKSQCSFAELSYHLTPN